MGSVPSFRKPHKGQSLGLLPTHRALGTCYPFHRLVRVESPARVKNIESGQPTRPTYFRVLAFTQSPISLSTSGDIVSSILAYSETAPVEQGWNRWFRPFSSFTV